MLLSRKRLLGSVGIVALLLVIGLALTSTGRAVVRAAPPGSPNATPASPAAGTPGPSAADTQQLVNDALARFAARLGVSQQTLNDDFIASVNGAIDQAVRDGKLTQEQGTKIKAQAAHVGLAGVIIGGANSTSSQSNGGGAKRVEKDQFFAAAWEAALEQMTTMLGLTPDQLKQQLGTQRIADIAQAHHVDLAQLRAAMLAAGQAKLNQFVQAGQITQAQADDNNRDLVQQVDGLLTLPGPQAAKQGDRWQDNGPGADALQAAWEAGAAKIGIDPAELKKEMAGGKTVAAIAADHGVTVQQLRDTMIAAGRASIDNAVKSGKVPQDQANTLYTELDKQVDQLINTAPASK